ncbi:MAG: ABC transporter ATP-binding protein [Chloroflexota bacterium]|nr:ABC transporter ATP-binding protein [Chloroflexota bacterium]
MNLLEAWDLYRFYHTGDDETRALRGVSLHLAAGELVALLGPSGSGKSTLLACLAGLDEPDGGHVTLLGQRLTRRPEAERAARRAAGLGILLQRGNLFAQLTIAENLRLQQQLARRVDPARITALLAEVGLPDRDSARPADLSGGEAARAGLAVALAAAPPVLLADEPTGEVDGATEVALLDLLTARRQSGAGTLVATHSAALAARADRVLHLRDGRLVDG